MQGRHRNRGGRRQDQRQQGQQRRGDRGRQRSGHQQRRNAAPATCPMCGAVVNDLRRHMHEAHDDPQSHPRD